MKNNIEHWKILQENNYFENHPCYQLEDGALRTDAEDDEVIARFLNLEEKKKVAIIGCGFGRDVAVIAPKVEHVWGIDVSRTILNKAEFFLKTKAITNFTPVLAESWKTDLPDDLDLVYSFIVFQHLTRDLVQDYVINMPSKLCENGEMICQFADMTYGTRDAGLEHPHEPSVRWNKEDIKALVKEAGMYLYRLDQQVIEGHGDWWWAYFGIKKR